MRTTLIELRNKKNLSVKEIAQIFDISESFYYKIEAGTRNPNFELTKKIADFFEKDIDKIFFNQNMDDLSRDIHTT